MTAAEIELLANTIEEATRQDNSLIYVVISIVTLIAPMMALIQKYSLKKTTSKLIRETVTPQIDLIKRMNEASDKSNTQMFAIMEMHIEELRHVKSEHEIIKKKVSHNTDEIRKLKN